MSSLLGAGLGCPTQGVWQSSHGLVGFYARRNQAGQHAPLSSSRTSAGVLASVGLPSTDTTTSPGATLPMRSESGSTPYTTVFPCLFRRSAMHGTAILRGLKELDACSPWETDVECAPGFPSSVPMLSAAFSTTSALIMLGCGAVSSVLELCPCTPATLKERWFPIGRRKFHVKST